MAKQHFMKSAMACIANGRRLLDDAEMLEYAEPPSTAFALAIIAQEEMAKGFLLALVGKGVIPWNALIYRASRDHTCKQLLGIVMEYLNPDFDEFLKRSEEWHKQHNVLSELLASLQQVDKSERRGVWQRIDDINESRERFPAPVADAINILRHEKIGRWKSPFAWTEDPQYDPLARMTGDGSVDREKQDALYVRLSRSGELVGSPSSVTPGTVKEATERAKRFAQLVDSVINDSTVAHGFEKLEQAIKLVFQDLQEVQAKQGEE